MYKDDIYLKRGMLVQLSENAKRLRIADMAQWKGVVQKIEDEHALVMWPNSRDGALRLWFERKEFLVLA